MESYLTEFHGESITDLLNDDNDSTHVSINVSLMHLQRHRPDLYSRVIEDVWSVSKDWDRALLEAQKKLMEGNDFLDPGFQIKENCHIRFINLPQSDCRLKVFPNNDHIGLFVQVKGNVVRITQGRLLEYKREYICNRCKEIFVIEAEYEKMFVFEIPRGCKNPLGTCKGILQPRNAHPKPEYCIDYQELRIQELFSDKNVPSSLSVVLENDLVDICQPGDSITVCGTIKRRWRPLLQGKRSEVSISLRAVSICKEEEKVVFGKDVSEQILYVRSQWQDTIDRIGELNGRDTLVQSISPEIHGMYLIKLAIALSLCSGIEGNLMGGGTTRGHSHLLLVGDPGLAKSKLLRSASKIAVRSVHTTGMGCSAAGLTAAAVKEDGEWQLEAGALVLADGGVCCIDEFNLMRESDKASIHEAMEQQTISMAKAGLVCKLSTRCVVIAATNPKSLHSMCEYEGTSSVNIGIGSPLLSRFDLVFILRDEHDVEWDSRVIDHILNTTEETNTIDNLWDIERLQSHFLAVHDINPKLTDLANIILGTYYKFCRSDEFRDPSRTTVRLLDSLNRLAQAHAKLLFRNHVNAIDAIVIIYLMESSWGFGRMIKPINILKADLPIGPTEQQIKEILTMLNLNQLEDDVIEELQKSNKIFRSPSSKKPPSSNDGLPREDCPVERNKRNADDDIDDLSIHQINDLESMFGYNKNVKRMKRSIEDKENNFVEINQTFVWPERDSSLRNDFSFTSAQNHDEIFKESESVRKNGLIEPKENHFLPINAKSVRPSTSISERMENSESKCTSFENSGGISSLHSSIRDNLDKLIRKIKLGINERDYRPFSTDPPRNEWIELMSDVYSNLYLNFHEFKPRKCYFDSNGREIDFDTAYRTYIEEKSKRQPVISLLPVMQNCLEESKPKTATPNRPNITENRPKISPSTLNKLKVFRNPNYKEKSFNRVANVLEQIPKATPNANQSEDSAYNTMTMNILSDESKELCSWLDDCDDDDDILSVKV